MVKLGRTAITCRNCGEICAVDNADLEALAEHKCLCCGIRMSDYELVSLKLHYYMLAAQLYREHFGRLSQYRRFDYDINYWPHYEYRDKTDKN